MAAGGGVRSTAEVLRHVAGDNYYAAAKLLKASGTGIVGSSYEEVSVYESRAMSRAEVIRALEESFALMKQAMAQTPDSALGGKADYFSKRQVTVHGAWVAATTHLHEHLGQLVAYARSVGVVPPWSR
jgi:hypothetical protein